MGEQLKQKRKLLEKEKMTSILDEKIPLSERDHACPDLRHRFKQCIRNSECVKDRVMKPSDCIKENLIGQACQSLYAGYKNCCRKRADPRYRIKGEHKGKVFQDTVVDCLLMSNVCK